MKEYRLEPDYHGHRDSCFFCNKQYSASGISVIDQEAESIIYVPCDLVHLAKEHQEILKRLLLGKRIRKYGKRELEAKELRGGTIDEKIAFLASIPL